MILIYLIKLINYKNKINTYEKTFLLIPVGVLSMVLGVSFVSANNTAFTVSLQGDDLAFVSTSVNTNLGGNTIYRDGEDNNDDDNQKNASGTIKVGDSDNSDINRKNASSSNSKNASSSESNKDEDEDFEINGDEERSNNDNRGSLISDMAKVHTGSDLHLFVQDLVHKNTDITIVKTKEDRVSVTRIVPARLFGFIPVSTKETAEVVSWGDGTEQVNVSRPWWNFFFKNEISTDTISADIEFKMKNIPSSEFKTTLDATTKARIISEIQAVFIANGFATSTVSN